MNAAVPAVLGHVAPHWIGRPLGPRFDMFQSRTGIRGLYRIDGERLHLICVIASQPGCGQFREFIGQAKRELKEIAVWEIWSPILLDFLTREGFAPTQEYVSGEFFSGLQWSAAR